jgi:hypothetical protein
MRRYHLRKRTLFMLVLLLIGGATVNVAVAWGCAFHWQRTSLMSWALKVPYFSMSQSTYSAEQESWWRAHRAAISGSEIERGHSIRQTGVEQSVFYGQCFDRTTERGFEEKCGRIRAGWPMLTLEGANWQSNSYGLSSSNISNWTEALLVWKSSSSDIWMPLRILWFGGAVNTFTFACALFVLTKFAGLIQRAIRRKHGCCVQCGYDLRGQPVDSPQQCPECGAKA